MLGGGGKEFKDFDAGLNYYQDLFKRLSSKYKKINVSSS